MGIAHKTYGAGRAQSLLPTGYALRLEAGMLEPGVHYLGKAEEDMEVAKVGGDGIMIVNEIEVDKIPVVVRLGERIIIQCKDLAVVFLFMPSQKLKAS